MAAVLKSYLGFGAPKGMPRTQREPVKALPANWYTSPEMYELERRSIWSRKWLIMTHERRLKQSGDFLRYQLAGFDIVITRDRAGKVTAFHNVCRHRAYPVVEKDEGTAKIFSCRYHGWSYGLNGKLAKAPGYQDLPSFNAAENGLFPIHTRIDVNGFIWINLDASAEPEIKWESDFHGVDTQDRFSDFDFGNYDFDHTWSIDADYNWKIAADNYNECYHCKTTHPDIPALANIETYDVHPKDAHIDHDAATSPEQRAAGMLVAVTYYWPHASMNITPHFFFLQKFLPTGPQSTNVYYEVYRNRHSSTEDYDKINQIYKRVMSEDKSLCNGAQKNLAAGIFTSGELHPHMEKGPLYFQKLCRDIVTEWHKREKREGKELWPARPPQQESAEASSEDEEFCNGLSCGTEKEKLAW